MDREGVSHNAFFLEALELDRASGGDLVGRLPEQLRDRVAAEPELARLRVRLDEVSGLPWNAVTEADWVAIARELVASVEVAEADPLLHYLLLCQVGRAAENGNNAVPPFYGEVGGRTVNTHWYLAGAAAADHPEWLGSDVTSDDAVRASVAFYAQQIEAGGLPRPD